MKNKVLEIKGFRKVAPDTYKAIGQSKAYGLEEIREIREGVYEVKDVSGVTYQWIGKVAELLRCVAP